MNTYDVINKEFTSKFSNLLKQIGLKFRETFGVELCYCGIHGKEGCFYIAGYDKYNDPSCDNSD